MMNHGHIPHIPISAREDKSSIQAHYNIFAKIIFVIVIFLTFEGNTVSQTFFGFTRNTASPDHNTAGSSISCDTVPASQLPVYLLHYSPLLEREDSLIRTFKNAGFNIAYPSTSMENADISKVTNPMNQKTNKHDTVGYLDRPPVSWITMDVSDEILEKYKISMVEQRELYPHLSIWKHFDPNDFVERSEKGLRRGLLELGVRHMYALTAIANSKICDALIFEDDVELFPNFLPQLDKYRTQLPRNYNMLFLGDTFSDLPQFKVNPSIAWMHIYPSGKSRTTDGYLVSRETAREIIASGNFTKMSLPIDWHYNFIAEEKKWLMYWAIPPLLSQGTVNGRMPVSYL